ncbi:hypothetical protein B0A48_13768 [Cryoendolithus antarcticus]|uniref:Uncharacterized protein n=1 Tax=Cryoendolithus antarcticus TaxID=1507870 RepID=A0A1V8SMS2_9PEZI|nr:hypothetical protein B0A48_13768 [Cryoendolithus antarcticus]
MMAPLTRRSSALAAKIATLQLQLAPLVPLPSGPPHPAFPKTLLTFQLLTEDELDSIAHHYHQSTPGPWTMHYPAVMNWDKKFLARPTRRSSRDAKMMGNEERRLSQVEVKFVEGLMETVKDIQAPEPRVLASTPSSANSSNPYAGHSDKDRIRIKRRKVGKFIGLVGMDTPVEEIAGRIQASLERAVEASREELRRNEEIMLRRRKFA